MSPAQAQDRQTGFTLLELLVSVAIFVLLSGAIFGLLGRSQKSYQTESQVLDSFQEARLGMDQIVRDANDAGYPPSNHFSNLALTPANTYAQTPVAWNPGYTVAPVPAACTIGGTCVTPTGFDVIFEEDNGNGAGVQWIRYQLNGTTLWRGVIPKIAGADPNFLLTVAAGTMFPYVQNVMNNATAAQIGAIQAAYPAMFPGGNPVPVFQYTCDVPNNVPQPCTSAPAAGFNFPANVQDVQVTLIVQTPQRDVETNRLRLVELSGRGHRINPNK